MPLSSRRRKNVCNSVLMVMSGDTARRKYCCCYRNKLPRFGYRGHGHQRRSSVCCSLNSTLGFGVQLLVP
ncbi:hypothetical protein K1719_046642 [Acacia pycnantha]|nr:hypothetical protein K1719_046642 [Acacia pycnantha]